MSSIAADRSFPADDHSPAAGYSWRKIVLTTGTLLAVAAAIYSFFPDAAWVQIVGQDVLRTNASKEQLRPAIDAVVWKHQNIIEIEDGKKSDPTLSQRSQHWGLGPAPKVITVEVTRGKTELTDKGGNVISIETITATDHPTLVFVQCENDPLRMQLVNELVTELNNRGVETRMP